MSADPKSLATLAITANLNKRDRNNNNNIENNDQININNSIHDGRKQEIHKFRSTDEFIAGWVAAFINTSALFPINKLIFRQMAGGHKAQFAADQMKEEGLRYLYRGILPPLIQKMVSVSIMFGTFGQYKKWADNKFTSLPPITNLVFASCLTGATEAILTPLERVQMLLQDRVYHRDYKNTIDALVKLREFGPREYYRGITCVLMRNCPSNILFFGLRDEVKNFMPWRHKHDNDSNRNNINNSSHGGLISSNQNDNKNNLKSQQQQFVLYQGTKTKDSMIQDFLSGAILGMFISTLFYPLSVVRTRMQTRAPGTEFLSIVKAFNAVYSERDRKFSRLFHGCLINVLRQFVSWGVINCSYEYILDFLHNID